jgi:hypothetical protein
MITDRRQQDHSKYRSTANLALKKNGKIID